MATATVQPEQALTLTTSRTQAARELQAAVKIGQAIRSQRIRDMRDLDDARREKQEWVQRTMELLARLVNREDFAELFNDFVPTILPEYAEFDLFVEVFEQEMRHRLGRLQGIAKTLSTVPEAGPLQPEPAKPQTRQKPQPPEDISSEEIMPQQTVAAAILTEPEPARLAAVTGALIVRTPDEHVRTALSQFVQKMGITLHLIDRQTPSGAPIIEELNKQRNLSFAMVLVDSSGSTGTTPDDLFDLGCCVGRMGANRVYALHVGGESSTDHHGIAHVPIDSTEGWQLQLARLLRKAGVQVDLNKLV